MEKLKPRTLSGFMELLPAPQQKFERMLEILRKNFALYGFTPIDTPIIELAEILLAKGGGETEKQIYRFQKGDSKRDAAGDNGGYSPAPSYGYRAPAAPAAGSSHGYAAPAAPAPASDFSMIEDDDSQLPF